MNYFKGMKNIRLVFAFVGIVFSIFSLPPRAGADFSFADFEEKVLKRRASRVSEAIALFPTEYLRNYTLIRDSQSLQQSSPLYPRAILFGDTAKTIYTFNGDSSHQGYSSLETVEAKGDNLLFREVVFLGDLPSGVQVKNHQDAESHLHLRSSEIAYLDENIVISKPNPSKCIACHASNFKTFKDNGYTRYIWDAYPNWPTAYGSTDDSLVMAKGFEEASIGQEDLKSFPVQFTDPSFAGATRFTAVQVDLKSQLPDFLAYKKMSRSHPRYRFLHSGNDAFPFHASVTLMLIEGPEEGRFVGAYKPTKEVSSGFRSLGFAPNTRLGALIQENFSRVSKERLLKEKGQMDRVQFTNRICEMGQSGKLDWDHILTDELDLLRQKEFMGGVISGTPRFLAYLLLKDQVEVQSAPSRVGSNDKEYVDSFYEGASPQFLDHIQNQLLAQDEADLIIERACKKN